MYQHLGTILLFFFLGGATHITVENSAFRLLKNKLLLLLFAIYTNNRASQVALVIKVLA